jgi:polar amino acid transport system substrate-binding protein
VSRRDMLAMSIPALAGGSVALSAAGVSKAEAAAATGDRLDSILKGGRLRVGTFLQYKPFTFKNEKGEPDGFDTDIQKLIAQDMGVRLEFVDNTWDGIIPALQADKFDAIIADMAPLKKRALTVQFSTPYNFGFIGFIFRTEDKGRFSSLEKFNDSKVTISILIQDASHLTVQRFFPNAKVRDFNSAEEAILAVQTKKVDCSTADLVFLAQYIQEHTGLSIKAVDYPGSTNPIAMALTPGPDNAHLITFLNLWIQYFYWAGQAASLYKKWLPTMPLPKPDRFTAPI